MAITKRKVTVEYVKHLNTYFVRFVARRKHGHYNAAQFNGDMRNEEQVKEWVRQQPDLELIEHV